MDYEAEDKAALERALLALGICPRCRQDLMPVAFTRDVFGCSGAHYPKHSSETWYIERGESHAY